MKRLYNEQRLSDFRELVNRSADKYPKRTAFYIKKEGSYKSISYECFRNDFYDLCSACIAMGLIGKRIAVVGKNSYEWVLSYFAAATVGVAVPLDKELDAADIADFVSAGECSAIFSDSDLSEALPSSVRIIRFSEIEDIIEETPTRREAVDSIAISDNEMKVLLFTSGTTGSAKGVCLSQFNILSDIYSTVRIVKINKEDRVMSILPLHHTYECTLDCLLILSRGACITYAESLLRVQKNIGEYSPTVLVVVPALLQVLHKKITAKVKCAMPPRFKPLFEEHAFADAVAKLPAIVRAVIKKKVKNALGGKLRLFIVGAAALEPEIVEDFTALGIRTLQGYGLTECSPLLAGNSDLYFNASSTGIAIPGVELKIDSPNGEGIGEILAKGDNIMLGYFNDPEATGKVFTDGWFRTGDLGYLEADGALHITGRCKNVIVAENGKNIYPEELETRIACFSEVEEVIIVPYLERGRTEIKAKIYPCIEYLSQKLGHVPSAEEIKKQMEQIISEINKKIPDYKRIHVLEVLTETLEKTTTRKVKRYGGNLA